MCKIDASPGEVRNYKGDVIFYTGSGVYHHNVSGKMGWERLTNMRSVEYCMGKGYELSYVDHEDTYDYSKGE